MKNRVDKPMTGYAYATSDRHRSNPFDFKVEIDNSLQPNSYESNVMNRQNQIITLYILKRYVLTTIQNYSEII